MPSRRNKKKLTLRRNIVKVKNTKEDLKSSWGKKKKKRLPLKE